ncbi:MFS transporter [Streptomyces sp. NPDC005562]|uniref:MFS transporter n=1 Tax=Streptomyces sp. NPDC005562 TaxID=3154890 RepID=UPI0033A3470C
MAPVQDMAAPPPSRTSSGMPVRTGAVVGFLVFVELVSGVVQGSLIPLLPQLGHALGVSHAHLNWASSVHLLAAALLVPAFARLGDLHGHRRMLRITVVMVVIGTLLTASATSYPVLLVGRALQGPLAALLPLEIALVRDRLPKEQARLAIGMLVGALTLGISLGLVASGWIFERMGSPSGTLWIVTAFAAAAVPVSFFLIPESVTRARVKVDIPGTVGLALGLAAVLYGVAQAEEHGWTSMLFLACTGLGALVLAGWGAYELRAAHPMVDIRALARPQAFPLYLAAAVFGMALYGSQTANATFMGTPRDLGGYGFGMGVLAIGLTSLPLGLGAFAGSSLAPRIARTAGYRAVLVGGALVSAVGFVWMALLHEAVWQLVVGGVVTGIGTGVCLASLPTVIVELAPLDQSGIAGGLYSTSKTLGGSISGAAFATVLSAMTIPGPDQAVPSESAYTTVWFACAGTAVLTALLVLAVRRAPATEPIA